jgi:hypothetical protein
MTRDQDRYRLSPLQIRAASRARIDPREMCELDEIAMAATPACEDIETIKRAVRSGDYEPDLDLLALRLLGGPVRARRLFEE